MNGEDVTVAANHLFATNYKPTLHYEYTAQLFHHNISKILFLCKLSWPDIHTVVAFLTTLVKALDVDDEDKLGRVMKYILGMDVRLSKLQLDSLNFFKW